RRHSDIDLLVVVRRKSPRIHHEVRDRIVATILQQTVEDAKSEVTGSRLDLNAILGGWTSLKPLYDPTGILQRLRARARRASPRQFREAAFWACLEVYEDVGKLWNAIEAGDVDEAREMAIWFTNAAAGALLDLHARVLKTGRRGIVEASRFGKIGAAVRRLPMRNSRWRRCRTFPNSSGQDSSIGRRRRESNFLPSFGQLADHWTAEFTTGKGVSLTP